MGQGRGRGGDDDATSAGICCCGVFFVVGIILFACSWSCVEPTEYGLNYDTLSKGLDPEVYAGGRYLIGFTHKMLTFPAIQQTVEFSRDYNSDGAAMVTRTKEGLSLTLEISFQYVLRQKDVYGLYQKLNINYHTTFVRISRDAILKIAGSYVAYDYWERRGEIGNLMLQSLRDEFDLQGADVINFQMLHVDLPSNFESQITQTQVQQQYVIQKGYEQKVTMIESQIKVIDAQASANIVAIAADAQAKAFFIGQEAGANANKALVDNQAEVYRSVMQRLLSGTVDNLSKYMFASTMRAKVDSKMVVGFLSQSSAAVMNLGGFSG